MLTLQKTDKTAIADISTSDKSIGDLLEKEWLLSNSRGGYSASTIVGCNTRRYHGLLIGSVNPPANRVVGLSNCLEMVISDGNVNELSTFEFEEKFAPAGFGYMQRFRRDSVVHFDYKLKDIHLTKSVYLLRDSDTIGLVYDFTKVKKPMDFVVRPFTAMRDFHSLQKSYAMFCSSSDDEHSVLVKNDIAPDCELFLYSPAAKFETDPSWWFNFLYRVDKRRGQDFSEDLWSPGFFKARLDSPRKIVLWANVSEKCQPAEVVGLDIDAVREDMYKRSEDIAASKDKRVNVLYLAADQFVTERKTDHSSRTTILAGFPWFADWGRDAFISLHGLLLLTGRFEQARSTLTTFANAAADGMIPNRFDDRSNTAHFNSVDASLWFINAAFEYVRASGDNETFLTELLPAIRGIVDSYKKGNSFGIRADDDGLIMAGDEQTQLTWMDAKYQGHAFTPRYGKAVEINALWYNGLCLLAQFYGERNASEAEHYHLMADAVEKSFSRFWNEQGGYLNDCIMPDGEIDRSIRPNQIFAVSLPFSPISAEQQKSVVQVVQRELLTPYGLRTLSPSDSNYKGRYEGPQAQRDEAYHQGTVWAFLMGAFVEAYLKVNDFSKESKKQAGGFIEPLMRHLTEDGCIGSVSEIFDGDSPQRPRGCFAQAWSVAELLRAYHLIND